MKNACKCFYLYVPVGFCNIDQSQRALCNAILGGWGGLEKGRSKTPLLLSSCSTDSLTNFGLYLNKACTLKTWFSFLYSAHKKCGTMASELKLALSSSSVNTSSVSPNLCLASTASGTLKGERRRRLDWKHKNCASVSTCRPHSVVFMNIYATEDSFLFFFFLLQIWAPWGYVSWFLYLRVLSFCRHSKQERKNTQR